MITVTKHYGFEACHHLPHYDGACANLHGHSYKLDVTIGRRIITDKDNPKQGMILDFKDLKNIINEVVVEKYDHSNLNDFFENPTAELMVKQIAVDIIERLPTDTYLVSCKLWETESSYAEFSGLYDNLLNRVSELERLLKYADNVTLRPAT